MCMIICPLPVNREGGGSPVRHFVPVWISMPFLRYSLMTCSVAWYSDSTTGNEKLILNDSVSANRVGPSKVFQCNFSIFYMSIFSTDQA